MFGASRRVALGLVVALVLVAGAGQALAQPVTVTYSYPATVTFYPVAPVTYVTPSTTVTHYPVGASVSYYPQPVVTYSPAPEVTFRGYYTAPGYTTTTRYGLFGRPRQTTTYYHPQVHVLP